MFSSSQFEPNAAFSGGGFTSSQPSQAYDSSPIPKNRELQSIVPVTVKEISKHFQSNGDKSSLVINGVSLTTITLVGLVCEKDASKVTEVKFAIDDGTGRLECKRWMNEPHDSNEMESVNDGMYVRVIGLLKTFQGKPHLLVFSVRPITDFNEVTFHFVECVHYYSKNSESQLGQQVGDATQSVNTTVPGGSTTSLTTPLKPVVASQETGRKNLDDMILDYLKLPECTARQQGIHIDEIVQQMKIPKNKLEGVIQTLEGDGLIYSTIDEYHFKHIEL